MSDEHDIPVKVVDRRWWARTEDGPAAADSSSLKPTYVEQLEQQLAEKDRLAQEYLTKYRRAAQEFDEARARLRKEIARDAERSRREVFVTFLDVLDNLDRAIAAARAAGDSGPLVQGVDMVRQQFLARLEGFGIAPIDARGAAFDPALHEAVTVVPGTDPASDGQIVGIVRQGYRIGDDVLRPAQVAVSRTRADE